jgi:hypothetical protein
LEFENIDVNIESDGIGLFVRELDTEDGTLFEINDGLKQESNDGLRLDLDCNDVDAPNAALSANVERGDFIDISLDGVNDDVNCDCNCARVCTDACELVGGRVIDGGCDCNDDAIGEFVLLCVNV